ncbi:MAG TPA: G1 family glutamic endopeptidase [candidate division Zixibacteria bacterium]|nr:G1 family glutamic endopeptidase [candidate division Zixibacteria bacterium]
MKSSAFSVLLIGSLVLLVAFSPALALAGPIMAPGMRTGDVSSSSWYSTNWSGYAVTGSNVTSVQGSWIVPKVSGARYTTAYSSFWVGIDGFSSSTVEQIGTDSDVQRGRPVYYAWYEFYPSGMVQISSVAISPGDVMFANVTYLTGSTFRVSITDTTTGKSYSTTASVSNAARSSAEWIAEAPSSYFGVLPLANFGTINFGSDSTKVAATCFATIGGATGNIGSFTSAVQEITMVSRRNAVKALPSTLSSDGTSFSVTWESAGP